MMKRKSKYTMTQNIAWMIGNAWRICKSVLTLCVLCAAAAVAVNLTERAVCGAADSVEGGAGSAGC